MFNLVRSLYAAQYSFRVAMNLGSARELTDNARFPEFHALVRRARINGLSAKQSAEVLRNIVLGADVAQTGRLGVAAGRDLAINEAMRSLESDAVLCKSDRAILKLFANTVFLHSIFRRFAGIGAVVE